MAMAMQHDQQAWATMGSWRAHAPVQSCGGNTWSKRLASAMDNDSWEVRAFAEDASSSGQWPPRSYSCSFCQREFRTAQALGGHMNVHRRERAHANQLRNATAASQAAAGPAAHAHGVAPSPTPMDTDLSWLQSRLPQLPHPSIRTADLFSPPQSLSLSMSGPASPVATSPDSISSTQALFQNIPDILCESLSSSRAFHPYDKARQCKAGVAQPVNLGRFSACLDEVTGEHDAPALDLELRLGQASG